ncbi:protein seele [Halyomorpha halys]|uniref:protein seele n=1 Tax=Halyomorpha halys TaxID=286706 RepID=UPI0006D4F965|nr:protein seele [Halyomorpha halys]
MKTIIVISFFVYYIGSISSQGIDPKELKCLVCQKLVDLMEQDIDKVDPKKKVDVGSFRIDHKGDQKHKVVEYRRSEVYLTELMERICNKMEDYVRGRMKTDGRLIIFPLVIDGGKMNPIMSDVDVVQDSDLNKSLKFYCEAILEENDDAFIKAFSVPDSAVDIKICSEEAKLCNQSLQDDYEFETHGEL